MAGIDLIVGPGEIYGLVGPNGAGKTTTMRILATLLAPTAGEALVCGIDVTADPVEVRRRIGYMPDFYGVYDDLRVWEYLDFFARCYSVPAARAGRHDRRAARDRRPRPTSATRTSRRSRAGCASACAWPTRWSTTRSC